MQHNVTYFFRNKRAGFSIQRVFAPIVRYNETPASGTVAMPCFRADPLSILKNLLFTFRHRNKEGINHVTGDCHYILMALKGTKTVLTVHDLVTIHNARNPLKRAIMSLFWFKWPLKIADKVTCISNATRQDLLRHFKIAPEKVVVVYNPVDSAFQPFPKAFNKTCPVILHVGTGWNKNLDRVAEALDGIHCKLIVVGKISPENKAVIEQHKIVYENRLNLSDEEMTEAYRECDIVSFPSLFEGFGMPIIEGGATGRAVLTSDRAPMNEIADGSCSLVDPTSVESIRNGFIRLLTDDAFRESCIRRGLENAERFKIDRIANEYNKIYSSLEEP